MPMVDADWSIDRSTKVIQYIGDDHTGANPSYATVLEFHRWLAAFADDAEFTGDDEHDIVSQNASDRSTDNIITLQNGYTLGTTTLNSYEFLYDGSIIEAGGDTIYDGIVNFGNATVQIQIHQAGAVLADDWWNSSYPAGAHDGAADASVLTDSGESWTTDEHVGYTIYNTTDGSSGIITANTATTITATLHGGTDNDWDVSDAYKIGYPLNGDSAQGISHRFMVKVREDGVDIDRRRLLGTSRRWSRTFSEFPINGSNRGNNVFALSDSDDLNNSTAYATIDAYADVLVTEATAPTPRLLDIDNDGTDEEYAWEWDRGSRTINQFYEYHKHIQVDGSAETLNGINGELHRGITHDFGYDNETGTMFSVNDEVVWGEALIVDGASGTFTVGEAIHEDSATPAWKGRVLGGDLTPGAGGTLIVDLESGTLTDNDTFTGQTSAATGVVNDATPPTTPTATAGRMRIFAIDDNGTDGEIYGQILSGVAPVENQRIYDDTSTANFVDVDENAGSTPVTERTITTPEVGQSTGSALIGSYGLGMETADTSASDLFLPLNTTTPISPPNNVTFTVDGLVAGDRVLVAPNDAGNILFTQMATDTTLSGAAETSVSINPAPGIPDNTPATGTIRIERDSGLYSRHPYSDANETTDTFTITSANFSTDNATAPANVFISYIDTAAADADETFSTVFDSAQTLFIRVRDGGATPIKNLETTGNLTSTGGSVTVNRIDDT